MSTLLQNINNDTNKIMAGSNIQVGTYVDGISKVADAYVGHSQSQGEVDYLTLLKGTLDKQVNQYNAESQRIMDYGDMYANNTYIQRELVMEGDRTRKFIDKLRSKIQLSKLQNQEFIYQANRYMFYRDMILMMVIGICVAVLIIRLRMRELINLGEMVFFLCIWVLGFAIFIGMVFVKNSHRTRLDWTKYYWDVEYVPQTAKDCTVVNKTKDPMEGEVNKPAPP
jgi:hypothetical protein